MKIEVLEKKDKKDFRRLARWVINLFVAVTATLFVLQYFAYYVKIEGYSMEPAIAQNSMVLVDCVRYHAKAPERFDIAAYRDNADGRIQVKRIVGLPNEDVLIRDGEIYINGTKLPEASAYIAPIEIAGRASETVHLGDDEYFVIGDNPTRSQDSRFETTGNVSREQIVGRVWFSAGSFFSYHFWF